MFFRALILAGSMALAGHAVAQAPAQALAAPDATPHADMQSQGAMQVAQSSNRPDPNAYRGASGSGHLSVRGQDIVDPNGNPIVLRGWNWGHWGKALPQDAADNAAQGANVVRLPVRWWGYYQAQGNESRNDNAPAGFDQAHLAMLDNYIQQASRAHLWIILFIDSNCGQNGTQNANMISYCDPQHKYPNGHNFFTDPDAKARFIALWRFVASRYKDTPYMGMFEPLPEPGGQGTSPGEITAFYTDVMNAIRQVAPGIPFLVGPYKYKAAQVAESYNPNWHDVVYTGNLFMHENGGREGGVDNVRQRMQQLISLRAQRNVPIFVQQVGVKQGDDPDQSQVRAVLGGLIQNRIGFTYWEYRGSKNPDEYGVFYQNGRDWESKPNLVNAISQAFRAR